MFSHDAAHCVKKNISKTILPLVDSRGVFVVKKCALTTVFLLGGLPRNSVARKTSCSNMTFAVGHDV